LEKAISSINFVPAGKTNLSLGQEQISIKIPFLQIVQKYRSTFWILD
jgi:hypothetical protein